MVASLTVINNSAGLHGSPSFSPSGCNPNGRCGNGLEKIYPTCAVRFGYMNYIGEFKYAQGMLFGCGAKVVIQSERGIEIGQQVSLTCTGCDKSVKRQTMLDYVRSSGADFMRPKSGRILRLATPQDLNEERHLNQDADLKLLRARELAKQMNLPMKFVACEHLFGGERIIFHFTSEARVDFRDLVRDLAHEYHTRIEMHQVGARDEARLVADYEICGRECCCKNFLKTLRPVTMRMAKLQKATLDPAKVSGRCGRLRCCLRYEHEGYEELNRRLPRVGARVRTDRGPGTVRDRQILTQLVTVEYDADAFIETVGIEALLPGEVGPPTAPDRQRPDHRRDRGQQPPQRTDPPREPPPPRDRPASGQAGEAGRQAPAGNSEHGERHRRRGRRGRRHRQEGGRPGPETGEGRGTPPGGASPPPDTPQGPTTAPDS
jgi:cell fate regulator YaaT (PSP1 superfamily)